MQVSTLSADPEAIRIISFVSNQDSITIVAQSSKLFGICPVCQLVSNSLHSHYVRQIADLPWHGVTIGIQFLETWLEKARSSGIGEFIWFANGIEADRAAVEAAHSSQWSQGQVEGQVNRLKFIKRQMYGRGSFDLLKARVLHQF